MLAGNAAASNFLDKEFTSVPVGEPSPVLVEQQRVAEERKNPPQRWYQTLGIGADDKTETLLDGVKDQFVSGGSFAYDIYSDINRMYNHEPDGNWNPQLFLKNEASALKITSDYYPAFVGTSSRSEALELLRDIRTRQEAQKRVQRMGTMGWLTTYAIARLPDFLILITFLIILKSFFQTKRRGTK